jgi:dolichol kinase
VGIAVAITTVAVFLLGEWLRTRSTAFEAVLLRMLGVMMTPEERRHRRTIQPNGATWAMIAVLAALVLFPTMIGIASVLILAVGDPVAALVGRGYGRVRLGSKTLEGSIAFFFSSLLTVLLVTPLSFGLAAIGCVSAMLLEVLPIPGSDNVRIVLAAGLAMTIVWWLM